MQADSVIRTFKAEAEVGMNRVTWALDRKGVVAPDADDDDAEPSGPAVLPGNYTARITVGDQTSEAVIEVRPDPRREQSVAMVEANLEVYWTGQGKLAELRAAIRRLTDTQGVVKFYAERLDDWDGDEAVGEDLEARTDSVTAHITALLDQLRPPAAPGLRGNNTITATLGSAVNEATNSPYAPSAGRRDQVDWAISQANGLLEEIDQFYSTELSEYRAALKEAGFDPLS
jgi:hypothetical protein